MKHLIEYHELKQRADRIGLSVGLLATEAGLNHAHVYKWGKGQVQSPRIDTVERLERALIAREKEALRKAQALVEELGKLHPSKPRRNGRAQP